MEDLCYRSEVDFGLEAIEVAARMSGYQTKIRQEVGHNFLDVFVESLPYPKLWQWVKADEASRESLAVANPRRMAELLSGTIYIIYFTPSTLPDLVRFLKVLLSQYGGWLGMGDGMETVYDVETIEAFTVHPFFA